MVQQDVSRRCLLDSGRRTTRSIRPPRRDRIRLGLEVLEDRIVPAISYQGGPVMTGVNVSNVYYGSYWNQPGDPATTMNRFDDFAKVVTNSSYWSTLNEYTSKSPVTD
jgi:hypothetical protein